MFPALCVCQDKWEVHVTQRGVVQGARDGQYVYFASSGGVLRWDTTYERFDPILPSDGLVSVDIVGVAVDRRGNKWFAHGEPDVGVSLLDTSGEISLLSSFDGLQLGKGKRVNCVYALGDSVWIGTESGATLFINGVRSTVLTEAKEGIVSDNILSIVSAQGNVWLGTDHGLSRFSRGTVRNYEVGTDSLPSNEILTLAADGEGRIWGGTPRGIFRIEDNEATQPSEYIIFQNVRVRSIAIQDEMGVSIPWFATSNGPYRKAVRKANKTSGSPIGNPEASMSILVDEENEVWLSNSKRWMFRWREAFDGWETHTMAGSIVTNSVADIMVDRENQVWCPLIENEGGNSDWPGIALKTGDTWYTLTADILTDSLKNVTAVAIDSNGNRWFGIRRGGRTPGNLFKIPVSVSGVPTNSDIQYFDISNADGVEERTQAVYSVEIAPDNSKWTAVTKVGMAVLDAQENQTAWGSFTSPGCLREESNDPKAHDIAFSSDGRVWLGTTGQGAFSVNTNGTPADNSDDICREFSKSTISSIPDDEIIAVRGDDRGNVWFGTTSSGLIRFNTVDSVWTKFYKNNTDGNLPGDQVRAIAFDRHGNTWIGVANQGGLACLLADGETWLRPWTVAGNASRGSSLTSNEIYSLFIRVNDQNEEEIWIATWGGGVCKLIVDWQSLSGEKEVAIEKRILAYPNPYRWGGEVEPKCVSFANEAVAFHNVASLDSLDGDVSIDIYTLSGEFVQTIEEPVGSGENVCWCWDLKNERGVLVAAGVYLFVVKKDDIRYHVGKMALIR